MIPFSGSSFREQRHRSARIGTTSLWSSSPFTSPEPTKPRLAAAEKAMGSRERAAGEHWNLGEGVGVRLRRRRNRWRWGLEGRLGAAEDRRRKSFEEGGAARRSRERRRPWAAVAGGSAGGGCGGGESLVFDGRASLLPHLQRAALLPCSFLSLLTFFSTSVLLQ
jgi:hypothetical protein